VDIRSLTRPQLEAWVQQFDVPPFRAGQIFEWLHRRGAASFEEMTDLPKGLRRRLAASGEISALTLLKTFPSAQGDAIKYLFESTLETIMESVLMRYAYGWSACVSTQAGCKMGCAFCASASGFLRDLTPGEICGQVYGMEGGRATRVVLMGCGEPLDNYDGVLAALRILNDPLGRNIGQRHMTLSTCGLVEKIEALAKERLQITLAVSLHAPNDPLRRQLMPVAAKYPLGDLLAACRAYGQRTGRRVTLEYALIAHVNDSPECARELAARVRGGLFHVNIIPLNPVAGKAYAPSGRSAAFAALLRDAGVAVTVRRRLGGDIDGACGQLRLTGGY
jgi:23S rRNA (adenine2503-C2)-methyltransferase